MKRLSILTMAALAALMLLGVSLGAKPALAVNDFCNSVTGSPGSGECVVNTSHSLGTIGNLTFSVDRTLHITTGGALTVAPTGAAPRTLTLNIDGGATNGLIIENGGKITADSAAGSGLGAILNINVASGDVILAASGAFITADNTKGSGCGGAIAGTINLTANGTNAKITTEDGSVISASALNSTKTGLGTCSAGAINISAPNKGEIDIDGDVLAESGASGSGTANSGTPIPTGGTQVPGGGPIFITAACNLTISDTGTVSSKGQDPGADLVHLQGGCDVLINGLVQSTGVGHAIPGNPPNSCSNVIPHAGSVRRNPATRPGKPFNSTACVEVWAGNSLTINRTPGGLNGEINADTGASPGGATGTSWIDLFARGDIKILNSTSTAAVHANGNAGTDNGGVVTVKSRDGRVFVVGLGIQANASAAGIGGTVDVESFLDTDLSSGRLEARSTGSASTGNGGHIIVQSFSEDILSDVNSVLDVTGHTPPNGLVDLTACKTIGFPPGTIIPAGVTVNKSPLTCASGPTFEQYVVLPDCPCGETTPGNPRCEKASVKSVLNPVTGRFPGNLGPDVVVRLDLGQKVQDAVDTAGDFNGDGYILILVVKDSTGTLGGHTTENVVISRVYPQRFGLLACSVTINAADAALAAGHVTTTASSPVASPENIFVMDLHGADSGLAGWLVEGNKRYMRNVANHDNQTGIEFIGNNNTMHNGNGNNNTGDGILVQGNGNLVDSSDAFGNGGNGVTVVGDSNKVLKVDAGDKGKGNGGDGVNVTGNGNTIQEVDAYSNGGNGIKVAGNTNQLLKNNLGDRNKANGLDGINLVGNSNKIQENEAYANGGNGINASGSGNTLNKNKSGDRGDKANGLAGFLLSGGSSLVENTAIGNLGDGFKLTSPGTFSLSKNVSGGSGSGQPNGGCQYKFDQAATNGGNNKSNNVTLVGTFPAGSCK